MAIQAKNMIDQEMDPNKFDRRTHIWDGQGRLIKKNLYIEYVRDGNRYLERPVNSGNLWTEGNQPCGRVEKTFAANGAVTHKKFDFEAPHKDFVAELTGDEALHFQLEQERGHRTKLEAELAAIKAERDSSVSERSTPREPTKVASQMGATYAEPPKQRVEPKLHKD